MKHTPGPWKWWTSNSFVRLTAEGGRDGGVLSARSHSDGMATVAVSDGDARLIAAAPDLLEALNEAIESFELDHHPDHPTLVRWRSIVAKATSDSSSNAKEPE